MILSAEAAEELVAIVLRKINRTKRLYSVAEAAEYLGCSAQQVRNLVVSQELPNASFDSHIRIDAEDLDKMIEARKTA